MSIDVVTVVNGLQSHSPSSRRNDPIDLLPSDAAAKVRCMREAREAAQAATRDATERLQDAIAAKYEAQARLRQLRGDAYSRKVVGENHPAMLQAVAAMDATSREVEHRQEVLNRRQAESQHLGSLLSNNIEHYLGSLPPGIKLEPIKLSKSPVRANERPENAIKRHRADIQVIKEQIEQTKQAPIPSDLAKEIARDHVAHLARRGAPDVLSLINRGDPIQYSTAPASLTLIGRVMMDGAPAIQGQARGQIPDAIAYLAFLFPEAVLARLDALIDQRSDDQHALSDEERERRLRYLNADLLTAEHLEEAAICLCERSGMQVERRLDSDPRTTLGIIGPEIDNG